MDARNGVARAVWPCRLRCDAMRCAQGSGRCAESGGLPVGWWSVDGQGGSDRREAGNAVSAYCQAKGGRGATASADRDPEWTLGARRVTEPSPFFWPGPPLSCSALPCPALLALRCAALASTGWQAGWLTAPNSQSCGAKLHSSPQLSCALITLTRLPNTHRALIYPTPSVAQPTFLLSSTTHPQTHLYSHISQLPPPVTLAGTSLSNLLSQLFAFLTACHCSHLSRPIHLSLPIRRCG